MTTSTTTIESVRDNASSILEGLVLASLRGDGFRRSRGEEDFRGWALANPGASLRRFAFSDAGTEELGDVSDSYHELVVQPLELVIAYPADFGLYGIENEIDLEDFIQTDLHQISGQAGIGLNNAGGYVAGLHALLVESDDIEREETVWFSALTMTATYYRSVSA